MTDRIDEIRARCDAAQAAKGGQQLKFILYLFRWQLSTPILAVVTAKLAFMGYWGAAVVANLIGGCIFFWVDRMIFRNKKEITK